MVRTKNRYIVVQIVQHTPTTTLHINEASLAKCVLENVRKYYGEYGIGVLEQGLRVKYCNSRTKIAIIRCSHRFHQYVTSILPLVTMITNVHAKFCILYTGATILQCNKFILKHQQRFIDRSLGTLASAKERQDLIQSVMHFDD